MDDYELGVCTSKLVVTTLLLTAYSGALIFMFRMHYKTLGILTKVLLLVPLLEYVFNFVLFSIVEAKDGLTCLRLNSIILDNAVFFLREASFLVVNIFMLKNLSVYVRFRAGSEEEDSKAKKQVRTFSIIYFVVLITFEGITAYYNLDVYCIDCAGEVVSWKTRALYITANIVKFGLNLVLVAISFMHAN